MKRFALVLAAALLAQPALADPVKILAAENFYADIAEQIGGKHIVAHAVLSNPDQDPHLFEASPSVARNVKAANLVIVNGAGYDEWMTKLLAATPQETRKVIDVAALTGAKDGDNPHLWYDVARVDTTAKVIAEQLSTLDPAHKADYAANLQSFSASLDALRGKISTFAAAHSGADVTASEPVFGYMAAALKLKMHNESFQLAIMNNTEPSASDVAAFESSLKTHTVKAMLYNAQAGSPAVERLKKIATAEKISVVPITETEPAGTNYQSWMGNQIDALDKALNAGR